MSDAAITETKRGVGRPVPWDESVAETILNRIIDGESLRAICEDENMPNRRTVLRWLAEDAEYAAKYAQARELQGDLLDERIQVTSEQASMDDWQLRKMQIETMKWRAAKLHPKRYGDTASTVNVGVGVNVTVPTVEVKLPQAFLERRSEE